MVTCLMVFIAEMIGKWSLSLFEGKGSLSIYVYIHFVIILALAVSPFM